MAFLFGILVLIAMAGLALALGIDVRRENRTIQALNLDADQAQAALLALVDAETGFRGFALTGDEAYLQPYFQGLERLSLIESASPLLFDSKLKATGSILRLADMIQHRILQFSWGIENVRRNGPLIGDRLQVVIRGEEQMDSIRELIGEIRAQRQSDANDLSRKRDLRSILAFGLVTAAGVMAISLSITQFFAFRLQIRRRAASESMLQLRGRETELAADMVNALQAAATREESLTIIADYSSQIMPGPTGALYTYDNSLDQLVLSAAWGGAALQSGLIPAFAPDECWALRRGEAYMADSGRVSLNCHHVQGSPHQYLCLPITAQGVVYGVLHFASSAATPELAFSATLDTARGLANRLSLALANLDLREKLRSLSIRDPLTGLFNRRVLDEILDREVARADRVRSKLGVAMIDIDHFKTFNDQFGHKAGDVVLKAVCDQIVKLLRRTDLACRYGGEEIVLLLPEVDLESGMQVCEKLRSAVSEIALGDLVTGAVNVTISVGFSLYPDLCSDRSDLLASADRALYRSKHNGRNQVTCWAAARPNPSLPPAAPVPRITTAA
jgi:diguanylate cyclase (GGDEF)-like protein